MQAFGMATPAEENSDSILHTDIPTIHPAAQHGTRQEVCDKLKYSMN